MLPNHRLDVAIQLRDDVAKRQIRLPDTSERRAPAERHEGCGRFFGEAAAKAVQQAALSLARFARDEGHSKTSRRGGSIHLEKTCDFVGATPKGWGNGRHVEMRPSAVTRTADRHGLGSVTGRRAHTEAPRRRPTLAYGRVQVDGLGRGADAVLLLEGPFETLECRECGGGVSPSRVCPHERAVGSFRYAPERDPALCPVDARLPVSSFGESLDEGLGFAIDQGRHALSFAEHPVLEQTGQQLASYQRQSRCQHIHVGVVRPLQELHVGHDAALGEDSCRCLVGGDQPRTELPVDLVQRVAEILACVHVVGVRPQ